jgi:hypothetical protein
MALICRVVIGYFDPDTACARHSIVPKHRLDEAQVARLQAACDEVFGIKLRLAQHLTQDGLLCIEDVMVRHDTYKAAAVAHGLFGMPAVDHAHRRVIFPAEEKSLPERDRLIEFYQSLLLDMDEQQRQQKAEEDLRWMREEREFERAVQERVRSFAVAWRGRAEPGVSPDLPRD